MVVSLRERDGRFGVNVAAIFSCTLHPSCSLKTTAGSVRRYLAVFGLIST